MSERGDWNVSQIARNAFDLEGKVVGTIGAGRIGYRVLQRLQPFNCKELLYYDYAPLPESEFRIPSPSLSKSDHHGNRRSKRRECSKSRGFERFRFSM